MLTLRLFASFSKKNRYCLHCAQCEWQRFSTFFSSLAFPARLFHLPPTFSFCALCEALCVLLFWIGLSFSPLELLESVIVFDCRESRSEIFVTSSDNFVGSRQSRTYSNTRLLFVQTDTGNLSSRCSALILLIFHTRWGESRSPASLDFLCELISHSESRTHDRKAELVKIFLCFSFLSFLFIFLLIFISVSKLMWADATADSRRWQAWKSTTAERMKMQIIHKISSFWLFSRQFSTRLFLIFIQKVKKVFCSQRKARKKNSVKIIFPFHCFPHTVFSS